MAHHPADPFELFDEWYAIAKDNVPRAEVMALATVSSLNQPNVRMVRLVEAADGRLIFGTSYTTQKATDIEVNDKVSCLFYWGDRQVQIQGTAKKTSDEESDEYYSSAPVTVKKNAWALEKSETTASAAEKINRRPRSWGGYAITPSKFQFWVGGNHADKVNYVPHGDGWKIEKNESLKSKRTLSSDDSHVSPKKVKEEKNHKRHSSK